MKKLFLSILLIALVICAYFKYKSVRSVAIDSYPSIEANKTIAKASVPEKNTTVQAPKQDNQNKIATVDKKSTSSDSVIKKLTPADFQAAAEYFQTMKQTYAGWDDSSIKAEITRIDGDIKSYRLIERANNKELSNDDMTYLAHLLSSNDAAHAVLAERSLKKIQEKMNKLEASLKSQN